jgi:hypothetical protein
LRLEPQGGDFFAAGAGAKAARCLRRSCGDFSEEPPVPADASFAYRPNPKANNQTCLIPPVTEGLLGIDKKIRVWH